MFGKLISKIKSQVAEYKKNNSLPGDWKLYEYYTEYNCELTNFKEPQIVAEQIRWDIEFKEDGVFQHSTSLNIPLIQDMQPGRWSRSRNFVTIVNPTDFRKNIEFQFAFEKGNLKILKKDSFGKIIIFAFFKRIS
jgi:hypothetical protein